MAQRHRTQERNRQDALDRLIELIRRGERGAEAAAADPPDPRLEGAAPGDEEEPLDDQGPAAERVSE